MKFNFKYLILLITFCVFNANAGLRTLNPRLSLGFLAKIPTATKSLIVDLGRLLQENDNSINKNMCIMMVSEMLGLNDEDSQVVLQNLDGSEVNYKVSKENFGESQIVVTKDNILYIVAQIKNALDREKTGKSLDPLNWDCQLDQV